MVVAFRRWAGAFSAMLLAAPVLAATPRGLAVADVTITANGARSNDVSGDETAAQCARFRLTPAEIRTFFALAGRIDAGPFNHDLSMSRCHAAGTLRTGRRAHARWFIDLERRGSLQLANGRTLYFYCLACRSTKFDEVGDEDRETAQALFRASRER